MREHSIARSARGARDIIGSAVALIALAGVALAGARPAGAQGTPTPARPAANPAPAGHEGHAAPAGGAAAEEIAAFARLTLAMAQVRDSVQRELALARNKTPQMQQQLRGYLATQLAEIKRRAGVSDSEYRRRTFLVSTDSAARAVYDETIAKLTGAPLPGRSAAAGAPLPLPAGPAGVHAGHVANAFSDTPGGQGLLPTALAEARTAAQHAQLATRAPEDLAAIKSHAIHVAHAVDPTAVGAGPGAGYGVKRAALGVATHLDLAAKAPGAPAPLVTHAAHAGASARNTVRRADDIVALVKRIQGAATAAEAAGLASQLVSLTNELVAGRDADADGRVGWAEPEGGLAQCEEHVRLMLGVGSGGR